MHQRMAERARSAADEGDDVDRIAPKIIGALAELDHELAPPRHHAWPGQRLALSTANQLEQRLVPGRAPGELDVLIAQLAQKHRSRRVQAAELADIEHVRLALP